jgi:hypothetical protein
MQSHVRYQYQPLPCVCASMPKARPPRSPRSSIDQEFPCHWLQYRTRSSGNSVERGCDASLAHLHSLPLRSLFTLPTSSQFAHAHEGDQFILQHRRNCSVRHWFGTRRVRHDHPSSHIRHQTHTQRVSAGRVHAEVDLTRMSWIA